MTGTGTRPGGARAAGPGSGPARGRIVRAGTVLVLALAGSVAFGAPKANAPAPIEGVVTRVVDGDTLLLQPAGQPPIDVRLRDIDAPEICQAWGPEAKKALEEFALGKTAVLLPGPRDAYGRTLGVVTVDSQNLGRRMVEDGHAWSVRFKWDNGPLVKQERQAKALGRGLHATAGAVMPRDFRRTHGACAPAAAAASRPVPSVPR